MSKHNKSRKAISMPMETIIAIIILVVIALAIIVMTTDSIRDFLGISKDLTQTPACMTCKQAFCVGKTGTIDMDEDCATACGRSGVIAECNNN